MGSNTSLFKRMKSKPKGVYLTRLRKEEVLMVKNFFDLDDEDDIHSLSYGRLTEVWDWMARDLRYLWCEYIFLEYEYHVFPMEKFVFLYRSHTLFKVDYKVDIVTALLSIKYTKIDMTAIHDFTQSVITSYLNGLLVYCNHEMVTWYRQYSAPYETTTAGKVATYMTSYVGVSKNNDIPPEELRTWLWSAVLLSDLLSSLANMAFGFSNPNTTISLLPFPSENATRTLLDISHVLLLRSMLVIEERLYWRLLYSTKKHGESYSTMVKKIVRQGPTVVVVRDLAGYIFGAYASSSWDISPNFYGDGRCFLFTLSPKVNVYKSSGLNDHYMYLNANQRVLPNGLGMGGQKQYWGLWIDGDFGYGTTENTCSTFFNYQLLAENNEFRVTELEVWGVGGFSPIEQEMLVAKESEPPPHSQTQAKKVDFKQAPVKTIRDADPEAKMLIQMAKDQQVDI